jgi:hypothetical protein
MRSSRSRRSSISRSRSSLHHRRSSFSHSSFRGRRFRGTSQVSSGNSVPLHPLSKIFLGLLLASFFFNFVMTIVAPFALFDWGLWIFFLPIIFAGFFMVVTVITTVSILGTGRVLTISSLFQQSGRRLIPLTLPSTIGRYFEWLEKEERFILVTLPKKAKYDSRLLQTILEPLKQQSYRELWIVQDPSSFIESDYDYARFYNVVLLTITQLQEKLTPTVSAD